MEEKQLKVLVAEDDDFIRQICGIKFQQENFRGIYCSTGRSAIQKAKEEKPDIILLDIILPDLNGFDVLEQLKQDSTTAHIPIIVLSNLGNEGDIQKAIDMGAETDIYKAGHTIHQVIDKIKDVASKYNLV